MPVNDTTTNRGYQKPNIANTLADDVGRLRSALDTIDTDMASKAPSAGPTFTGVTTVDAGSAAAPSLTFTGATSDTGFYSPSADQVAISTGGTGRLFVSSTGAVGVGAPAAAGADFEVRNTGANSRLRVYSGTVSATSGTSSIDFVSAFSGSGVIGTARISGNAPAGGQSELSFLTSAVSNSPTERLRLTSDGYLRLAGKGIQFNGDTADANSLDDYEEGTFTPTIVGTTIAGTGTYSAQYGSYTKIGNRVFFQAKLTWSAHTGTGDLRISGLPFTSQNTVNLENVVASYVGNLVLTASNYQQAYVPINSTQVIFEQVAVGGGTSSSVPIDTAATVLVDGHYII